MDNCIFCQIIARVLPCDLVYEDDHFLAFLDINPVRPGHTLVIPKEHHQMMIDMPEALLGQAFILAQHIMQAMKSALSCDFVMVSVVGTDVSHFHIQLIPRSFNDGLVGWPTMKYQADESVQTAAAIKRQLS